MIAKLPSRFVVATIFTLCGDFMDFANFMQYGSHRTRAYFIHADGLRGYFGGIVRIILKEAIANGEFKEVTKHQKVHARLLLAELKEMPTEQYKIDYLGRWYPCLYIYVSKKTA